MRTDHDLLFESNLLLTMPQVALPTVHIKSLTVNFSILVRAYRLYLSTSNNRMPIEIERPETQLQGQTMAA
jgi:hypothetical protein